MVLLLRVTQETQVREENQDDLDLPDRWDREEKR